MLGPDVKAVCLLQVVTRQTDIYRQGHSSNWLHGALADHIRQGNAVYLKKISYPSDRTYHDRAFR
jgi:hypothetical protein